MAAKISNTAHYRIVLKKAIRVGCVWLRPGKHNIVSGVKLREHEDAVLSYEKVA